MSLETCASNLESVAVTALELLPFNAHKITGSRDNGHAPFSKKNFMSGLYLGTCMSNMKSAALTISELLTLPFPRRTDTGTQQRKTVSPPFTWRRLQAINESINE